MLNDFSFGRFKLWKKFDKHFFGIGGKWLWKRVLPPSVGFFGYGMVMNSCRFWERGDCWCMDPNCCFDISHFFMDR